MAAASPGLAAAPSCSRLTRAIAAGSVPTAGDFEPAACPAAARTAFRYDARAEVLRAARDLEAGDVVAEPPAFAVPAIRPGQSLYVRSRSGPVVVEREVRALQPANVGARLFVQAADGAVFTAPVEAGR